MKNLDFLTQRPIAHRGLHDETSCENSLSAFEKAIALDLPIELDVQASLEGIPVVFHDDSLDRLTALNGPIYHQTVETLETTFLKETSETIPTLKTVLKVIDGRVPLLIEIKSESPYVSLTKAVIETLQDYAGLYTLQSFDPKIVTLIKKLDPTLIRGQISGMFEDSKMKPIKKWGLSRMIRNVLTRPDYIVYDVKHLDKPWVLKNKYTNKPVLAYTLTTKKTSKDALKIADNVIFEGFSWDE
jgi:glycerophosphoryl diester phosphodiesterase